MECLILMCLFGLQTESQVPLVGDNFLAVHFRMTPIYKYLHTYNMSILLFPNPNIPFILAKTLLLHIMRYHDI